MNPGEGGLSVVCMENIPRRATKDIVALTRRRLVQNQGGVTASRGIHIDLNAARCWLNG